MGMGILVTRSVASVKSNEQGFTTIASVFALTPFAFGTVIGFIVRYQVIPSISVYGVMLTYSYPIIALLINSYWAMVKKAPANISASSALVGMVSGFWITDYAIFIYRTSTYWGKGLYEIATLPLILGILVTILFLATNGVIGGLISLLWLALMLGPFVALYFVLGGANWSYSVAGFTYGLIATLITAFIVWLEQFIITRWQARRPKKAKGA
jgi:hypothetical protein